MSGYNDHFKKVRKNIEQGRPATKLQCSKPIYQLKDSNKKMKASFNLSDEKLMSALGVQRRKKAKIPWRLALFSTLGFLIAGLGLYFVDDLDSWMGKFEVGIFDTAKAKEEKDLTKKQQPPTSQEPKAKSERKPMDPLEATVSKSPWSEDQLNHLGKLVERKKELDTREMEVQKLEEELEKQRKDIITKLEELQNVRREIASTLSDKVKADEERIGKLVEFYSDMKPQMAAQVIQDLDEELAVEVLGRMKKSSASAIMNLLSADKAKILSEKFAGFKSK